MSKILQSSSLIVLLTSVVGCSTVTQTAQYDIARMAPDCANANAMIRYLDSQLETPASGFFKPSARDARSYRGTTKELIWDTREDCGAQ